MAKHTLQLRDGTEIDPADVRNRLDAATHLVRALSNSFDDFNQPRGGVEPCEACRGIVALLEALSSDLAVYFECLSPPERERMQAYFGARRASSRRPQGPGAAEVNGARADTAGAPN